MSEDNDDAMVNIEVSFTVPTQRPFEDDQKFELRCLREISKQWAKTLCTTPPLPSDVPLAPPPDEPCLTVHELVKGANRWWYPVGSGRGQTSSEMRRVSSPSALAYLGDATFKIAYDGRSILRRLLYLEIHKLPLPYDAPRACAVAFGGWVKIIFRMRIAQAPKGGRHLEWVTAIWDVKDPQ